MITFYIHYYFIILKYTIMFGKHNLSNLNQSPDINSVSSVNSVIMDHSLDAEMIPKKYELFDSILKTHVIKEEEIPADYYIVKKKKESSENDTYIPRINTTVFDLTDETIANVMLYGSPDNWPPNKQGSDSYNILMDEYMKSILREKHNKSLYAKFEKGIIDNINATKQKIITIADEKLKEIIPSTVFTKEEMLNYFWKGATIGAGIFVAFWVVPAISLPTSFISSIIPIIQTFIPSFDITNLPGLMDHLKTQGITIGIKVYGLINDFKEIHEKHGLFEAVKDLGTESVKYATELVFIGYIQYNLQSLLTSIQAFTGMKIPNIIPPININIPFLTGIGLTKEYFGNIPTRMLSNIITGSLRSKLNYLLPETKIRKELINDRKTIEEQKKQEDEAANALRIELEGPGFKDIAYEHTVTRWKNFKKEHGTISNILSIIFVSFIVEWFIGVYATNAVNSVVDVKPSDSQTLFESIVINTNAKNAVGNITSITNNYLHMSYAMPIINKAFDEILPIPENMNQYLNSKLKYDPNINLKLKSHHDYLALSKHLLVWFKNILAGGIVQFTNMLLNIFRQDIALGFAKIAEYTINNAEKIQENINAGIYSVYNPIKEFYNNIQTMFSSIGKPNDDDDKRIESIITNPETTMTTIDAELTNIETRIKSLDTLTNPFDNLTRAKLEHHIEILTEAKLSLLDKTPFADKNSSTPSGPSGASSNSDNYLNSVVNSFMAPFEYVKSIISYSKVKLDPTSMIKPVPDESLAQFELSGVKVYTQENLKALKETIQTNNKSCETKMKDENIVLKSHLENLNNQYKKLIVDLENAIKIGGNFIIDNSPFPVSESFDVTYLQILNTAYKVTKTEALNIKDELDSVNEDNEESKIEIESTKSELITKIDKSPYLTDDMKITKKAEVEQWAKDAQKYNPNIDLPEVGISTHINKIDEHLGNINKHNAFLSSITPNLQPKFRWGQKLPNEQSPKPELVQNTIRELEQSFLDMNKAIVDGKTFLDENKPKTEIAIPLDLEPIKKDMQIREIIIKSLTIKMNSKLMSVIDENNKKQFTVENLKNLSTDHLQMIHKKIIPTITTLINHANEIDGRITSLNAECGFDDNSLNCDGMLKCSEYTNTQIYSKINNALANISTDVPNVLSSLTPITEGTKGRNDLMDTLENRLNIANKYLTRINTGEKMIVGEAINKLKIFIINSTQNSNIEEFHKIVNQHCIRIAANLPQFERNMKETVYNVANQLKATVSEIADGHIIYENTKLTTGFIKIGDSDKTLDTLKLEAQKVTSTNIDNAVESIETSMVNDFINQIITDKDGKYQIPPANKHTGELDNLKPEIDDDKKKLEEKNKELSNIFIERTNEASRSLAQAKNENQTNEQINSMEIDKIGVLTEEERNKIIEDYGIPKCPPGLDPRLYSYTQQQVGRLASTMLNNVSFNQLRNELYLELKNTTDISLNVELQNKLLLQHQQILDSLGTDTEEGKNTAKWAHNCIMGTSVGDACQMDPLRNEFKSAINKAEIEVTAIIADVAASTLANAAKIAGAAKGAAVAAAGLVGFAAGPVGLATVPTAAVAGATTAVAGMAASVIITTTAAVAGSVSKIAGSVAGEIQYISNMYRQITLMKDVSATIGRAHNWIAGNDKKDKHTKTDYSFTAEHASIAKLFTSMKLPSMGTLKNDNPIKQGFEKKQKESKDHYDKVCRGESDHWNSGEIAYTKYFKNLSMNSLDDVKDSMKQLGKTLYTIIGDQHELIGKVVNLYNEAKKKESEGPGILDGIKHRGFGAFVVGYESVFGARTPEKQASYDEWDNAGWGWKSLNYVRRLGSTAKSLAINTYTNIKNPEELVSADTMRMSKLGTDILDIIVDIPTFTSYNKLTPQLMAELRTIGKKENTHMDTDTDTDNGIEIKMMMSGKVTGDIEDYIFDTIGTSADLATNDDNIDNNFGFLNGMTSQGRKSVRTLLGKISSDDFIKGNSIAITEALAKNKSSIYGDFDNKLYQFATMAIVSDTKILSDHRNRLAILRDEYRAELISSGVNVGLTAASSLITSQSVNLTNSLGLMAKATKWARVATEAGRAGRLVSKATNLARFANLAIKAVPAGVKLLQYAKSTHKYASKVGYRNLYKLANTGYTLGKKTNGLGLLSPNQRTIRKK